MTCTRIAASIGLFLLTAAAFHGRFGDRPTLTRISHHSVPLLRRSSVSQSGFGQHCFYEAVAHCP
jgi:hypothetical protein